MSQNGTVTLTRPLLLVGCGKMGGAMLEGWLAARTAPAGVHIVEPSGATAFAGREGVTIHADAAGLPDGFDPEVVVLAVKPQQMDDAVASVAHLAGPETLFLSIAAGKTLGYFEDRLDGDSAILRAMPNTPSAIGQGITVICPNAVCSERQRTVAAALLSAVGETATVEDESLMDTVTALSGGGPAYVFWLIECMAEAGAANGLPQDLAERLALVTVAGAGQLALRDDADPAELRRNVTSPGGTTKEALDVLMDEQAGLAPMMRRAIAAAAKRSRELAG